MLHRSEGALARSSGWSRSIRDFWIDRLWVDLAIAAVVIGAHMALVLAFSATDVLGNALPVDRRGAYSSAAIVVSLLGSFSSVAISQLSSAKGARADALRKQGAEDLARSWRSVFRTGMVAAVVAIFCLLVDPSVVTDSWVPVAARWIFEFCVALSAVKFLRLSALFYEVITLASRDSGESDTNDLATGLKPVPGWNKKAS
jgi:predicted lysophospholipase L1 biosynthesis ABC-type transport system permease subunit